MEDILDVFKFYIDQYKSVDIAESEFKKAIHEDSALRANYREWCREVGSTEKYGFTDFCKEYIDEQNTVWDSLSDFDNEE